MICFADGRSRKSRESSASTIEIRLSEYLSARACVRERAAAPLSREWYRDSV
jgi:hypothetical protein